MAIVGHGACSVVGRGNVLAGAIVDVPLSGTFGKKAICSLMRATISFCSPRF